MALPRDGLRATVSDSASVGCTLVIEREALDGASHVVLPHVTGAILGGRFSITAWDEGDGSLGKAPHSSMYRTILEEIDLSRKVAPSESLDLGYIFRVWHKLCVVSLTLDGDGGTGLRVD